MTRVLRVELLIGTPVLSIDGKRVGRIEEVRAGDGGEVAEFLLGRGALLERLSAVGLFHRKKNGYRVRWDQMDWSDRKRPRLNCDQSEIEPL
jgi:sporulation protein YlmC with PRC-barrel domain